MPFQFTNWPVLLILPLLYGFFIVTHRRTVTDLSPARKRAALAIRMLLATLLVFCLAGFRFARHGDSLAVVFLVDSSHSVRGDDGAFIQKYLRNARNGMRSVDRVGVITFAQDAHTQSAPGQPMDPTHIHDTGDLTVTNIEQAINVARNELNSAAKDSGKRIVLLSDGNENAGRSLAAVRELATDGIVLDTVSLPASLSREALIDRIVLPNHVKIGEPFTVRIIVTSLTYQSAAVALTRDGRPVGQARAVALHPGKNVVQFEQGIDKPGFFRYTADLQAREDTIPENNRGEGFVWVRGKPTMLYCSDSPVLTGFLQKALKSANINVDYVPPAGLPTSAAALQRYDSVFLSNVRASDLSVSQMTALQVACRDFGVGFGMVGGENSFGAGGYRGTPLEETLPVSMDVKKEKRLPSVAVAMVIESLEIQSTINMSIEAAKATIELLEPIDQVGVLDCEGGGYGVPGASQGVSGTWRIPMQHVTDREALKVAMQNLQDMGDPPSYDSYLNEAARVLDTTDAKVKHIVFLGDGDAVWEANQSAITGVIKGIRAKGITISTIASGADQQGIQFMAALASTGGGAAYVADQPGDLPRLMLKDQETFSQPPIIEEPFRAQSVAGDEVLKGVDWPSAPLLLGYNVSNLKSTATASLISHRNDPIFASWRYGLGRSVAFLSDDRPKWAAAWIGWEGYAKFWAQAVRWTLRPFAPGDYSAQVSLENGRGHITTDAIDEKGGFINGLHLRALIAGPRTGGVKGVPADDQTLRQTGPGHYEAWFDAPDIGSYLVNVLQGTGAAATSQVVGLSTAYSPEYRTIGSNDYLLSQVAEAGSGRTNPPADTAFGGERPVTWSLFDISARLLLAAVLLFPLDIAVRRISLDRSDLARAAAWLRRRAPHRAARPSVTPELGRLLDRKEAVAAGVEARRADDSVPIGEHTVPAQGSALPGGNRDGQVSTHTTLGARPTSTSGGASTAEALRQKDVGTNNGQAGGNDANVQGPEGGASAPAEASGMSRLMAAKRRALPQEEVSPEEAKSPEDQG